MFLWFNLGRSGKTHLLLNKLNTFNYMDWALWLPGLGEMDRLGSCGEISKLEGDWVVGCSGLERGGRCSVATETGLTEEDRDKTTRKMG